MQGQFLRAWILERAFPADSIRAAKRKLEMLNAANSLKDLQSPPSNRLEALKRDRAGSTRSGSMIGFGSALCGPVTDAQQVEITDYH
jgi:toxin HigB-1